MRKNKTGGRGMYQQRIVVAAKKKDGTPNPDAGRVKMIAHKLTPKEPPPKGLWGMK